MKKEDHKSVLDEIRRLLMMLDITDRDQKVILRFIQSLCRK